MQILKGKAVADKILQNIKSEISSQKNVFPPRLDMILVGDDFSSEKYVQYKQAAAEKIGIIGEVHKFPSDVKYSILQNCIKQLNADITVSGFMMQLPLPSGINEDELLNLIDPLKDVDGLTSVNYGKLSKVVWNLFKNRIQEID